MARERRVLLFEDDPVLAGRFVRELRQAGVALELAATAGQADAFVRRRRPALVLLGVDVTGGLCRELIEAWGSHPVLGEIPIWILGGGETDGNGWWHGAANVQRYFAKSAVVLGRLSLEIRASLGLPYVGRDVPRRVD